MLSLYASGLLIVAAIGAALYLRRRGWLTAPREQSAELEMVRRELGSLKRLLEEARVEANRLEAAISRASALRHPSECTLERIEHLADAGQIDDPGSLAAVASDLQTGRWIDPFAGEEPRLAIAHLADQGMATIEIARRLGRPIGEVEFLLNLR
jgi:hypothetical protein